MTRTKLGTFVVPGTVAVGLWAPRRAFVETVTRDAAGDVLREPPGCAWSARPQGLSKCPPPGALRAAPVAGDTRHTG